MYKNHKIKSVAICLFACSFALLGYFIAKTRDDDNASYKLAATIPDDLVVFHKVEFDVHDAGGNKARVLADKINKDNDQVFLSSPIIYARKNGDNIRLSSKSMSVSAQKCVFDSEVNAELFDKINIKTNQAYVDVKAKTAEGNSRINVRYNGIFISANSYFIDLESNLIEFKTNVVMRQASGVLHCDIAKCYIEKNDGTYNIKRSILDGSVSYLSQKYSFSTNGTVLFENDQALFNSFTTVTGTTQNKRYKLETNKMNISFSKNKIQRVACNNGFKFYIANKQISGNSCVYANNVVHVNGNVEIKTENGVARGDKASYNISTGKLDMQNIGGVLYRNVRNAKI